MDEDWKRQEVGWSDELCPVGWISLQVCVQSVGTGHTCVLPPLATFMPTGSLSVTQLDVIQLVVTTLGAASPSSVTPSRSWFSNLEVAWETHRKQNTHHQFIHVMAFRKHAPGARAGNASTIGACMWKGHQSWLKAC